MIQEMVIPVVVWDLFDEATKQDLVTEFIERQWEFGLLSDDVVESDTGDDNPSPKKVDKKYWIESPSHRKEVEILFEKASPLEIRVPLTY